MDFLFIGAVLFALATTATAVSLSTAVSRGSAFLSRARAEVQAPRINSGWISGGPVEAQEDEPELEVSNRTIWQAVGLVTLLVLINGAILAAAILFAIGAFTAGSALSVFVSSFVFLGLFVGSLAFGAKKARLAWRTLRGKADHGDKSHASKLVAEGTVWLFAINGFAYAAFFLFVAGLVRFIA